MSGVSIREFSYNPSAVFARVERGEAIEVTRHGKTIAIVMPGSGILGRYAPLIARGIIRLKPTTTTDLDQIPSFAVPEDASPLEILLAEREADDR
ncbi:MAG TPA: type II toxin-antitoxin system prevent-host-death family antitoxin [Streptosporangiaceae bacterium]|jgi:prevent-host-death family protein|nr:type II toxin-antitoxin system prevent-host-death family antitoxin [Streptosporangiaceae bacterium]